MKRRRSQTLTTVELEFMQVLWATDEASVEDIQQAQEAGGRPLRGGSVRKILSILVRKGYVTRRKEGKAYIYRATVPAGEANRKMVVDLLKRAFGGSAALMVATLLDAEAVTKKDVREIKKLIAERDREGKR